MLFFVCGKKSESRKKPIQNVEAKLHGILTYLLRFCFLHFQNKKKRTTEAKKQRKSSKRQRIQCIPLFKKKRDQNPRIKTDEKKSNATTTTMKTAKELMQRIHCAIVHNNAKDRGQFWLFHCS